MAASSSAVPSSTLSPNAAPYILRARPVCAPPGFQQDAPYFGMKSGDAVYPASAHGMHQSQPSSSSGTHVKEYPSSASSTSGYTWMASELKQEQFPLTSGRGRSGNKSTKVTIKYPPNRTLETNNIGSGSKSKLAIREKDDCNNDTGKDITFHRNLEFSNRANDSGSSQGTMELNPVLKPLCIPSTRASSRVSVAGDVDPDPSECSVDSPCWPGTLASRVSALDVRETSVAWSVKQKSVGFDAGKGSPVQDCVASTGIENLVASKSKQNHSQPPVESELPKKSEDVDTNLKNDYHGKELEDAESGAGQRNAEHTHCSEVRENCMKRSSLNSAAPDFIPSPVKKSSSGLPSSIISHGSCSSTGRNISEILKEIKNQSDLLQNNYSDDIKLEEQEVSLLQSIIEALQSSLYKARKGLVNVASDKARLKACNSQNAVSKSVAVNQNGIYTEDNGSGIIISNMAGDFERNSLTGYQPAPDNFQKESSCEDQVLIFKNLWIDAERANCALKYQLKQTRMAINLESSMAHNGGGPRNPSFQLCDMVTDPSSSVGLALTCPPMIKDHPGARKTPNIVYVGNGIHSGDNNVLSRSKDSVLKNIQAEHFMSDLEQSSIRGGLQMVPNKSQVGLNLEHF